MTKIQSREAGETVDERTAMRLLAGRPEPSAPEREALFDSIVAQVDAEAARERRLSWLQRFWGVGTLVAACGVVLFAVFRFLPSSGGVAGDEFQSRGDDGSTLEGPTLRVECLPAGAGCSVGGKLAVEVGSHAGATYFGGALKKAEGSLFWYLPGPDAKTVAVDQKMMVLDDAVQLTPEMGPGSYEFYGFFSATPLSRDELKEKLGGELAPTPEVKVIRVPVQVEP